MGSSEMALLMTLAAVAMAVVRMGTLDVLDSLGGNSAYP
jgi:hypothetical protein